MTLVTNEHTGVLLINLGTPSAPTPQAVKCYLAEFLSDPLVVSIWPPLWKYLLHTLILPFRSKKSAALYRSIWLPSGSPLMVYSLTQTQALQNKIIASHLHTHVTLAMRYGKPSISEGIQELRSLGIKKITVIPLYPQYAHATTGSAKFAFLSALESQHTSFDYKFIEDFYAHPLYIEALATQIENSWKKRSRGEKLLLSFHGLPKTHSQQSDSYEKQCLNTAHLLAERLHLNKVGYEIVFQSRFGFQKWLQPSCAAALKKLAENGCQSVDIFCPGFVADCLETLEEIAVTNKKIFLNAGGRSFHYIPALNASPLFIETLFSLI
ncbi:MAG: ferrochelatase [Gammaproteobacteria bacterium]|nr:ferrochelatase [Gammaproteobacteria bacterium]